MHGIPPGWEAPHNMQLFNPETGLPHPDDIWQTVGGSCWFFGAMATVAYNHPEYIRDIVKVSEDRPGYLEVKLYFNKKVETRLKYRVVITEI